MNLKNLHNSSVLIGLILGLDDLTNYVYVVLHHDLPSALPILRRCHCTCIHLDDTNEDVFRPRPSNRPTIDPGPTCRDFKAECRVSKDHPAKLDSAASLCFRISLYTLRQCSDCPCGKPHCQLHSAILKLLFKGNFSHLCR